MSKQPLIFGWREWASLPYFDIPLIKVKIDTGAKTSALHIYDLKISESNGKKWAHFFIHPLQKNDIISREVTTEIIDIRSVTSSNGYKEERPVIKSKILIGKYCKEIEITLTNRDILQYRMLLGREGMDSILVDPTSSYHQGEISKKNVKLKYNN